jgi:branched-subunit amino acid aminotransferase/4-amino-4-deoxychorismate lyase
MSTQELPRALVDSRLVPLAEARLAITDEGVARGDGAFETVGVWDGRPFRLPDHLDRLERSLERILLPPTDRAALTADVDRVLEGVTGDAALRCYVTASGTRIVTLAPQPSRPPTRHLVSQPAPWITPPSVYGPAGAKTMSYGPNMTATRAAQRAGGDDALLVAADGTVLEGPTFCLLWVVGGVLCSVPVERGIVDSISRRSIMEIAAGGGVQTVEAEVSLAELANADEVLVCSSIRPVIAVERIDDYQFSGPFPLAGRLGEALEAARRSGL